MTSGEDIELLGATEGDQDFIAHARQDIPPLLAEIDRLMVANKVVRAMTLRLHPAEAV